MKLLTLLACLLLCTATASIAAAQSYPNRPLKLLVGGAPGSVPDTMIRPIAERLAEKLGQPVIVENRPGAAGIIAMEALRKSPADGYTIAVATMSQAVFNKYLFNKLPYDPLTDLQPIAPLVTGAMVIAAHPSFAANSLKELIALSKRGGDKLFMAMPQSGSPPHVVALLLSRAAGIEVTMVPHKSGTDAVSAVLSGQIPLIIDAPTIISPHVRAGTMKAIVVTGREREDELRDVPTVAESGGPAVDGEAWIGLVAPAGTPAAIISRLNQDLAAIVSADDLKKVMARFSFRPLVATPDQFAKTIRDDHAKWSVVINEAALKAD